MTEVSNQENFDELFSQYHQAVFGFFLAKTSHREQAEDLLQETFLRVWKNIDDISGESTSRVKSWIFRVARNLLIDFYRRRDTRRSSQKELKQGSQNLKDYSRNGVAKKTHQDDTLARLDEEIKCLPEEERTILHMSVMGELSSQEIGELLEMPAGTVRYRLHEARKKLKKKLKIKEEL